MAAEAEACRSTLGGGTTPGETVPSWAVTLAGGSALATALRRGLPAIVGAKIGQPDVPVVGFAGPGYFRLSYAVPDSVIAGSMEGFKRAFETA